MYLLILQIHHPMRTHTSIVMIKSSKKADFTTERIINTIEDATLQKILKSCLVANENYSDCTGFGRPGDERAYVHGNFHSSGSQTYQDAIKEKPDEIYRLIK
jgi:hypothetical protein